MPTTNEDLRRLKKLGGSSEPSKTLDLFPNHQQGLTVTMNCNEFTCYCPATHQPDYATIVVVYSPDEWVIESKSFKNYLETYRQVGVFHEHLAVDIASLIMEQVQPFNVMVQVNFNVRGGINISAEITMFKQNNDKTLQTTEEFEYLKAVA